MKAIVSRLIPLCLVLALALSMLPAFAVSVPSNGTIRVNLTRLGSNKSITIKPTCSYTVKGTSITIASGSTATITASGSTVKVSAGGKTYSGSSVRLNRGSTGMKGIKFTSPSNSNLYCGDLVLTASSSKLTIILYIDVEDYLYGVVGYEMYPSYNIEALKAQAVAARNYALIRKASRTSKTYDVVDTSANQVFKGLNTSSEYTNCIKAVQATAGYVLFSGSSLAECYYTDTNGGQTESTGNAWGYSLSYSVVKDDPYDLASNGKVKTATINKDATGLNSSLKAALIAGANLKLKAQGVSVQSAKTTLLEIKSVTPKNAKYSSPSRLYKTLTFRVKVKAYNSSGKSQTGTVDVDISTYGALESWYSLSINSGSNETIMVTESSSAFNVSFRRFGHGIGLSQRGAQVMAKNYGKTWKQILSFYYPGTTLKKVDLGSSVTPVTDDDTADDGYTQANGETRWILSSSAVLRGTASESGSALSTLAYGTQAALLAYNGTWAKVTVSSKTGYVKLTELTDRSPASTSETDIIYAEFKAKTTAKCTLYKSASASSSKVTTVSKGTEVSVHCYNNAFAYVTVNGKKGFIRLKDLKVIAG